MSKKAGWITTILMALAAVFGLSKLPARKSPEPSAGEKAQLGSRPLPSASRQSAPAALKDSACWQIEKGVLIFFDADPKGTLKYAAPDSCFSKFQGKTFKPDEPIGKAQLRYIVATLPDPVHTHFALSFDRLTEALQQAAQDQGYNYDSSWLPWEPEGRSATAQKDSHDGDLQALQQAQPGVLVFRKAIPAKSDYCPPNPVASKTGASPRGTHDESAKDAGCTPPPPYGAGLIVFVVGENPTGGIDQDQFRNAFDWIQVLGGAAAVQSAGVVGPYFSGSLPSLYEGLRASRVGGLSNVSGGERSEKNEILEKRASPANSKRLSSKADAGETEPATPRSGNLTTRAKTVAILSGSVSSKAGMDWFSTQLKDSSIRFFSLQQNDDHVIDTYCLYLRNQGYDTGKLAILSEDETAYGVSLASRVKGQAHGAGSASEPGAKSTASPIWLPDCDTTQQEATPGGSTAEADMAKAHGPLYVYYPRDIAALRSAYDRLQSSGTASSQSSATTALPLDLAEEGSRARDTISNFGERQTNLSQEATLFGIANLFKAHGIQFIVLRSSNTLDQVFLTNFFSRTDPEARVVLTSADLLFRRSSETAGFRGTMTLTTYPLLTWQQDWTHWQTPQSRHSHRAFPEDTVEGVYLAARFLIDLGEPQRSQTGNGSPRPIPDGSKEHPLTLSDRAIDIQDYAAPSWLLTKVNESANCPTIQSSTDANKPEKTASPTRPPIWLSVVGTGQLWPVAVMGECIPEAKGPMFYPGKFEKVNRSAYAPEDTLPWADTHSKAEHLPGFQLPVFMFLCCTAVLGWSFWHFFCCLFGSHTSSIRLGKMKLSPSSFRSLAYFAPVPRPQHNWLIFIGCVLTWLLAVEIAAAVGVLHGPPYALAYPGQAIAYCVLLGALSWGALLANYRTYLLPDWSKSDSSLAANQNAADPGLNLRLMAVGSIFFAVAAFIVFWIFYGWILASLGPGTRLFTTWRNINLFTGVSATVPLLLLTLGLYGWFWYSLSGLALFNAGIPKLPHEKDLLPTMTMFSREGPGRRIQDAAIPLKGTFARHFLLFGLAYLAFWQLAGDATSIHALGPTVFGKVYAAWFGLLIVLVLTESWQMLRTWGELRELLTYLDRTPLRRTLQALGGISWGTVWKMSGNVLEQRYRLISRQIESQRHLENQLALLREKSPALASRVAFGELETGVGGAKVPLLYEQLDELGAARDRFVQWYSSKYKGTQYGEVESKTVEADLSPVAAFQKTVALTAAVIFRRILLPAWRSETDSLILESSSADKDKRTALPKDEYVRAAEEFFCLPYLGFIQNVLGRIRTMTLAIVWLFVAATLSVASYPFDPRPVTSGVFLVVFFTVAAVMVFVYAEMHRDPTLSHITNTNPGELGSDFWIKLITFGIGPLLGLLTALFPNLSSFVTSWLQPAVGSIK